jgi:hypothetical protein
MDAGALIEKRMKSLADLLPIVNPGLAKFVTGDTVAKLLSNNQWFFHFDFNWVDQSIVNTAKTSRHGIMLEPISDESRLYLLDQMRKTHGIGNFLWVGKDAHDRLLQEAPNLTVIMEPHQIKQNSEKDTLIFSIKFEQLIPRLQKYYGLDQMRRKIFAYEPTQEAHRLLKIMNMELDKLRTLPELRRFIESLSSYKWQGFKEKDLALQLLLRIFELHCSGQTENVEVINLLQDAASKIGYPSQIMTQAQLRKQALRDLSTLREHALNKTDIRFEESWSLLASLDFNKLTKIEVESVYKLIDEASCKKDVVQTGVTGARMIDATLGLIRRQKDTNLEVNFALLSNVILRIAQFNPDPEILTLALDALTFCRDQYLELATLTPALANVFEAHGKNSGYGDDLWSQSLKSRWQEFKSRSSDLNDQKKREIVA